MSDALLLDRQDAVAIASNNDAPYNRMTLEFMDALETTVNDLTAFLEGLK